MTYEKPPYKLSPEIYELSMEIQHILGLLKATDLVKPSLKLRKENKIKTVHHSLAIEGNSLTVNQITDILENKRVLGPKNQIIEVTNALLVYDNLTKYNALKEDNFKKVHQILMKGLVSKSGSYRDRNVGILKGSKVSHIAPQPKFIATLMKNLFKFMNDKSEKSFLIKACVFHYELEFIHPFEDGNGRIGRLWQQLLLMKHSSVFEFLAIESLIHKNQKLYYQVLEKCDAAGDSTLFIEFSLKLILNALNDFRSTFRPGRKTGKDRIEYSFSFLAGKEFSRIDYMRLFPELSTASASRDLAMAVRNKTFAVFGDKRSAKYKVLKVTSSK